jgi:hypothetical protein
MNLLVKIILISVVLFIPGQYASAQGEVIEFRCPACGYRDRFIQGSSQQEMADNIQNVIVVCERDAKIRNIKIAIDPKKPVLGETLISKQYGSGVSDLLGMKLPKFLVPGNTCPLFPVTAYLERNICPIDGSQGFEAYVLGPYGE